MKTAVMTGATGFLGRNIVDALLKDNWNVIALHRKTSDLSKLKGCSVVFKEADLHNYESVLAAIPENIEAIFHVAGNTSHWSREAEMQWKDNVLATRNLVKSALVKKTKRFIFTSTGATNDFQNTDEIRAQKIKNGYIRTKRLSELEVYNGIEQGLDAVILKPIIIIGKYDYSSYSKIFIDMKNNKLKLALPGKIAFCHAEDIALAHLKAYEKGRNCEHYVLGGVYTSWYNLFFEVTKILGVSKPIVVPQFPLLIFSYILNFISYFTGKAPLVTPDLVVLLRDTSDVTYYEARKAREDLGYKSRSFTEIVRSCYNWMKEEKLL